MRRALAIDEKSFGPEHPNVARGLNNLAAAAAGHQPAGRGRAALSPRAGHRREEPRARASQRRHRPQQPGLLLQATNRLAEAEPLMRRALAIDEKSFGPEHPNVAIRLNNLALLLQDTNRLAEAEPLYAPRARHRREEPRARASQRRHRSQQPGRAACRAGRLGGGRSLHRRAKPIMTGAAAADGGDRASLAKAALAANTWALRASARAVHRADATARSARGRLRAGAMGAADGCRRCAGADVGALRQGRRAAGADSCASGRT